MLGGFAIHIDAHQHFWKLERGDYGWLTPDTGDLYRDYQPEDLFPSLQEHGIDLTVVVQAAPTVAETEYLLELFDQYPFIAGVVGWLDLASPDFSDMFYRLRKHRGFVGIRPMLQDLEDDRWILQPRVMDHLAILVEEDFPLDLLVMPRHLPHVVELLQRLPNLRAVVDHAAKPLIRDSVLDPWREYMREIASYERVMCKLSGLITEADHEKWTVDDLSPYIQHVLSVFGADAVMFGSDWPVCLQAGSYRDVYNALCSALPDELTDDDLDKIFGGNAARFYHLGKVGRL